MNVELFRGTSSVGMVSPATPDGQVAAHDIRYIEGFIALLRRRGQSVPIYSFVALEPGTPSGRPIGDRPVLWKGGGA